MTTEEIGQRLRQLRCIAGIEQDELAPALGYKTSTGVSYLEKGQREIKSRHVDLAAAFFSEKLGESKEEVIAFLYGSRRWTLVASPALAYEAPERKPRKSATGDQTSIG